MPFTNKDLIERGFPSDTLFVVVDEPRREGNKTVIRVDPNQKAAIRTKRKSQYPDQYLIEKIRTGKYAREHLWLLSGGTLIADQRGRVAIGLRNGNSTDPFAYTNIGAGRCDQGLEKHCYQEMASEFVLCVQDHAGWHQVNLGQDTWRIDHIYREDMLPAVRQNIKEIVEAGFEFGTVTPPRRTARYSDWPIDHVLVEWCGVRPDERLCGFLWQDTRNWTLEFRLAVQFDLSQYMDSQIFYREGTGYAVWKSLSQIQVLANAQEVWQQRLITPFLEYLASARSTYVGARPTGKQQEDSSR